jgi:hypothetical protein
LSPQQFVRRLRLSKKDAAIKAASEAAAANPSKLDSWMKQQVLREYTPSATLSLTAEPRCLGEYT